MTVVQSVVPELSCIDRTDPGSAVPVRVRAHVLLRGIGAGTGEAGGVVSRVTGTFVGRDVFPAGEVVVRERV